MKALELVKKHVKNSDPFAKLALDLVSDVEVALGATASVIIVKNIIVTKAAFVEFQKSIDDKIIQQRLEKYLQYSDDYFSQLTAMPVAILANNLK